MLRLIEEFELDFVAGGVDPVVTEDIIIVGKKPNTVTAPDGSGGTWSYQFYSDGIALVSHNGGAWNAWSFNMDVNTSTFSATASIPPSLSSTQTNVVYHLTEPVADYNPETGLGPQTGRTPEE